MSSRTLPPDLRPVPEPPAPPELFPALFRPTEAAESPDLPGLRIVTVPDAAPPYDCDAHGAACPAQRDPARAEPVSSRGAGRPLEPGGAYAAPWPAAPGPQAAAAASTAAAVAAGPVWPRQFAQVVVEILAGARSARQIVPCTTDRVRAQISRLTPLVAADQRPRIQRIVMSHPTAHAVEMTVVVSFGPRARALAMRCEHLPPRPAAPGRPGRPARWLCTELEAG